jgi:hypothetical protein
MATYVLLIKKEENDESVTYYFGPDESNLGETEYNKLRREFTEINPVNVDNNEFYFTRAGWKLTMIISQEDGIFPNRTFFAS